MKDSCVSFTTVSLLPIDNLPVGSNWIVSDCNESFIFQLIPIIFKLTPDNFLSFHNI
jgi:hypothetical protein